MEYKLVEYVNGKPLRDDDTGGVKWADIREQPLEYVSVARFMNEVFGIHGNGGRLEGRVRSALQRLGFEFFMPRENGRQLRAWRTPEYVKRYKYK